MLAAQTNQLDGLTTVQQHHINILFTAHFGVANKVSNSAAVSYCYEICTFGFEPVNVIKNVFRGGVNDLTIEEVVHPPTREKAIKTNLIRSIM